MLFIKITVGREVHKSLPTVSRPDFPDLFYLIMNVLET